MRDPLSKLASISVPVRAEAPDWARLTESIGPQAVEALRPLLSLRNGLYAYEQALHVYSDLGSAHEPGLGVWNSDGLWKDHYGKLTRNAVFFGEDLFGIQFCLLDGAICTFDPETGATKAIAHDIAEWAQVILGDYEMLTAYPLAHEWQAKHGLLPFGSRLVPLQFFTLGGAFDLDNVTVMEAAEGMRVRGPIAVQIAGLAPGTKVKFKIGDE